MFEEEIAFAKQLAFDAGGIMIKHFQNHEIRYKADKSRVTDADEEINQLVIDKIKIQFPAHGVLGEEQSYNSQRKMIWVVDPLDGTYPYTLGLPISLFSIGFVIDGQVQFGVCYRPFDDVMYFGDATVATKNDLMLSVSSISQLSQSSVSSYVPRNGFIKNIDAFNAEIHSSVKKIPRFYSIVAEAVLIAEGKIEAAIFFYKTAHDIAGIKPIVEAAGGRVTNLLGEEQLYNQEIQGAIISNGHIHDLLVEMVRKHS